MINPSLTRPYGRCPEEDTPLRLGALPSANETPATATRRERLRELVVAQHAFAWRTLRRLGVSDARVDEAGSRVFDVVTRRLDAIEPGRERAFVVQVCARVASEFRRGAARRAHLDAPTDDADRYMSRDPSPEDVAHERERRALLDEALDMLDEETRAVFVLHELEQWTMAQIADSLAIPPGTVASRLRRGRAQFEKAALALRDRLAKTFGGAS